MKNLFEHMVTTIIVTVMCFVMVSILSCSMQVMLARRVHTSAIDQIQSSYYQADIDNMNQVLHQLYPNWNLSTELVSSINSRKDYRVILDYEISVPIFQLVKKGHLEGYAR